MNTPTRAAVAVAFVALAAGGLLPADPPKGPAVDTSFLTLYAETRGFTLGRPQKPKVTPDGKHVLFLRAEAKTPKLKLFEFDVAAGTTRELLSPEALVKGADENLTPEEKARRERQRVSVGGFTDYHLDPAGGRVLVKLANRLYVFDRATGKAAELKTGTDGALVDPKWSPDGSKVAYVRGFDVYVYDLAAGKESAVTTGGTAVKTHGLAEFVAQEEMHRHSGYWWSPDGTHIAYEEADHTGVEMWYVADPLKPEVPPSPQYYPRPGKKNVSVRLGVIPVAGGATVWVQWDRNEYEYLARVSWDKYGPLTIMLQNRAQSVLDVFEADRATGRARRMFGLHAGEVPWINLGRTSLHWAKDGSGRLHREATVSRSLGEGYDLSKVPPIKASWVPIDHVVAYDPETGGGLFEGAWTPHRMHAFRINPGASTDGLKFNDAVQLSGPRGMHTVAGNDRVPILTSTTPDTMPVTQVLASGGRALGTLPSVAIDPPFTPKVQFVPDPSDGVRLSDHGFGIDMPAKDDECFAGIVRPRDFDPKKKYPVVAFVYGGPTSKVVTQAMQPWLIRQWLADQGFVVVAVDNRGTPGRGRDWEKAVYQKFGTVPLDDQVKGLHALCDQFPELDRDRVGVVGWSFGGYMAANGVLRRPDVFKAAVAGAPVTDWADYDTHYTERYMGLLPEAQAAYDEASLIPLAKDLRRPLLLVHGTADDNVYYRHTLKLTDALFRAGRPFEALPLPGVTHMYSADPVVMERLWARAAGFFAQHLGGPK
jgi:dipeptidyl-peptidase-4